MDKTAQFSPDSIEGATPAERDTNIYVTQGGSAPRPPVPSFQPIPTEIIKTTSSDAPAVVIPEHTSINWGGVLKGVAIIAGVAVAAVVTAHVLVGVAAYAVAHSVAVATVAATGTSIATPIIGGISTGLSYAAGFIPHILPAAAGFFSHLAAGVGFGTAGATMTTLTPAASTAIGTLGAGSAIALAAPHAVHGIANLNLADHHAAAIAAAPHTTTTTTVTDGREGGFFSNLMATKSTIASHSTGGTESADTHSAFEVGHHSTHEHHTDEAIQPDADSANHKRAWTTRLQADTNYRSALAESGSHSAAVLAAKSGGTPIAPRHASFAEDLNQDRAALEAAMEPTR